MSEQLSLFAPVGGATPSPEVVRLAKSLADSIYLGTSSWSFPGWENIVYDRKANQTTLARHGLKAYAGHPLFRSVCIDRTYYGPISAEEFRRYAESVPTDFRFVVKAHEWLTSAHLKDDFQSPNPKFLDHGYALDEVVGPCIDGLGERVGVVLFQFPPQRVDAVEAFCEKLHRFLDALPRELTYALELRSPELLCDAYLQVLADVGAQHCFNVHPTMPSIEEQARRIAPASTETLVVRWMLRRTRTYGEAKDAFSPYDKLPDEDPESRRTVAALCRAAQRAYVIVGNKAEGCAPLSLIELAKEIGSLAG